MFARRAGWDLAQNALSARAAGRREAGLPLLDLTESNPARCRFVQPAALLRAGLAELAEDPRAAQYAPDPKGLLAAREAVAAFHAARGAPLDAQHVVLTAGTSEAYAHLFRLLGDPGDRVLVPQPGYPLFGFLAELEGLEAAPYALSCRDDDGLPRWSIDLASVRDAITPRTRALVVVSPHNPTGHVVSAAEARALRTLCAERGLAILSDEVFADFARAGTGESLLAGASQDGAPLAFVLSGVSKALALPQLKLGWIAVSGAPALRDEALARLEVISDTYLSVNGPGQLLLPKLLAGAGAVQRELRDRIDRNRAVLEREIAAQPGLSVLPSDGGWAAIVRIAASPQRSVLDEETLALQLLDAHGVLVHPGFFFDLAAETAPVAAHLVVSMLPPPGDFVRAARALAQGCREASLDAGAEDAATCPSLQRRTEASG